jgi:Homeodomain-like domain
MTKKCIVTSADDEFATVSALTQKGRVAARRLTRAHILRMAYERYTGEDFAHALTTSVATIERVREKFVLSGLDYALKEEPCSCAPAKLDGNKKPFWSR